MSKYIYFILFGVALSLLTVVAIEWHSSVLHERFVEIENTCLSNIKTEQIKPEHHCAIENIRELKPTELEPVQSRIIESHQELIEFNTAYIFIIPGAIFTSFLFSWLMVFVLFRQNQEI